MKKAKRNLSGLRSTVIICGLILLFTDQIVAQKLKDTISIREVTVFGQKKIEDAGVMITRIDTLALQMMKTQTISELLSSYSPVFMKSYGRGSTATASFRGTAPSHTQVYWNGIKLNSPMRGDVDFSLFPVYFIDDVSLLHGGSSLQSGSGALGGSVLINNKPDWTDRFSIRYVQTIESFSTAKEYLNLGFGNGRVQFKTRLFSDYSKNDFPYFNYGVLPMHETVQQNAGYRKMGLLQEVYSRLKKHTLSTKLWVYQSDRDLPQIMSFEGDVRNETQKDENYRAVFSWKYLSEKSSMEWVGGLNQYELNYFRSSTEANFVNFDSKSKEHSYTSQLNYNWKPKEILSFNGSFNSTYNTVSVFDRAQKLGYDKDRLELSLMNSVHFQPFSELSLSFLCRSDVYNNQIIGFIPSLGAEYSPGKKQMSSVKLNLSRNYHQPGLNDLYWLPGGNPNLKPEDGFSGDLAYAFSKKNEITAFSGQITGYLSLINNWIQWQEAENGASYSEGISIRKVFARGAEIQTSFHSRIANLVSLDLKGNYYYSATSNVNAVPSVDESRGKQLIYIPKHKANLYAEANLRGNYLKINAPFTGKRFTKSNNVESDYEKILNPYWLINISAGRTFNLKPVRIDAAFNLENLLNTDYMAILYRPMPGRYYSLTVQISYKK